MIPASVYADVPYELSRQWAEGALCKYRLEQAEQAMVAPEPPAPAHAAALTLGTNAVVEAFEADPLGCLRALWDWPLWARPTQRQPTDSRWSVWLILAGRGWGKTRTGVEWVRERIQAGEAWSIGLIGPSLSDVWKQLVHGTAAAPGLARVFPPWERRVEVRRQDRQVVFHAPCCGATGSECGCPLATVFTAEEPEVRGPNIDTWLCDELAKWRYLEVCWDNIEMTARAATGTTPPRFCVMTTPRPLKIFETLLDDPSVRVTWGSTFANVANVSREWIARMAKKYGGTRLGQQELFGQILGDNPDALFRQSWINAARVKPGEVPDLVRIVVAVDPSVSTSVVSDLTGIAVLGVDRRGHVYLLADLTGVHFDRAEKGLRYTVEKKAKRHSPAEWGELVCRAVEAFGADAVVVERNKGGDLVEANVLSCWRDALAAGLVSAPSVKVREVHATRGKTVRAEPVSALYEQGRVHHVGHFAETENQLTTWNPTMQNPGASPGRLDAIVWAVYSLLGLDSEPTPEPPDFRAVAAQNRQIAGLGGRLSTADLPQFTRGRGRRI